MEPTMPVGELPTLHMAETASNELVVEPTAPSAQAGAATASVTAPSAFDNVEPEETASHHPQAVKDVGSKQVNTADDDDNDDERHLQQLLLNMAASPTSSPTEEAPAAATTMRGGGSVGFAGDFGLSMKDLFGPFFQADQVKTQVADPALLDTRSMLQAHFGDWVSEVDVNLNDHDTLAREMRANKEAREQARVQQLFGVEGPTVLRSEPQERFTMLKATVPPQFTITTASGAAAKDGVWLIEMPRVFPNRQTLHADPQPFYPSRCDPLESDDRSLYTPQNVMRWAHQKATGTYMSNARVVRWSDGSVTLHVGSDTHSLESAKGNAAAHLLGCATTVNKCSVVLPAITKTLHPDQHFVVESAEAASIERAVVAESAQHRAKTQRMKLAYAATPLPEVDWVKPNAGRNPHEEYVAIEYERRSKELLRRVKEGRPMTLREQLTEDAQLFEQLRNANVEELIEQQREQKRLTVLQSARRAQLSADGQRAGGRSRLDRDLGLSALDSGGAGGYDPFAEYGAGAQEENDDDDDDDDGASEDSAEDIEALMDKMRAKREREYATAVGNDGLEGRKRAPRLESSRADAAAAYKPLVAALEHALSTISRDEEAYGEVEGMLTYMKGEDFSPSVLESEVRSLAASVSAQVPDADFSRVWDVYNTLYPN